MIQADQPVSSEAVRHRLSELFAQLQVSPAGDAQRSSPTGGEAEASVGRPPEDDWLGRLRTEAASNPPARRQADAPMRSADAGSSRVRAVLATALGFTREHLATVLIVLAVGVGWTAYSLLQVRSAPVADAAPRVESSPAAAPTAAPSSAGAGTKQVVVHVIGAVRKPGVVRLEEGGRLGDAIAAAGGLAHTAAVGELNLAELAVDGTQIKIGDRRHPGGWVRDGPTGTTATTAAGSGGGAKISLNKASVQQLDTLPGVGPVTAQKIVDWRSAHGRFSSLSELQEVDGIGPKTYADLAELISL